MQKQLLLIQDIGKEDDCENYKRKIEWHSNIKYSTFKKQYVYDFWLNLKRVRQGVIILLSILFFVNQMLQSC